MLALALAVAPGVRAAVSPPALSPEPPAPPAPQAPPAPPATSDREPDAEALLRRSVAHRRAHGGLSARTVGHTGERRDVERQYGVGVYVRATYAGGSWTSQVQRMVIGEQAWENREDAGGRWTGPLPPPEGGWASTVAAIDDELMLGADALEVAIRDARFLVFVDGGPGTSGVIEDCEVRVVGLVRRVGELAWLKVCPDDGQLLRAEFRTADGWESIEYADVEVAPLLPPEDARPPPAR